MAHIAGVFAHPHAGKLRVAFRATFFQGTSRDAGFPGGSSNYLLGATVNGVALPPLDRNSPVSFAELDYPGGNAAWNVATYTVATYASGIAMFGFTDLAMTLQLYKR